MKMEVHLHNNQISVENIRIIGVASSSIVLIGDADTIASASAFDTPPESLIVGPFVPLSPESP